MTRLRTSFIDNQRVHAIELDLMASETQADGSTETYSADHVPAPDDEDFAKWSPAFFAIYWRATTGAELLCDLPIGTSHASARSIAAEIAATLHVPLIDHAVQREVKTAVASASGPSAYTVIGYYEDNGQIWAEHVKADDPERAIEQAQRLLLERNDCFEPDEIASAIKNLVLVSVVEGHQRDLNECESVSSFGDQPFNAERYHGH